MDLILPEKATGIVLFAHGSGSSRFSPRNRYVAELLQQGGLGTLLFDLLTEEEDLVYAIRFNTPLLAERSEVVKSVVSRGGRPDLAPCSDSDPSHRGRARHASDPSEEGKKRSPSCQGRLTSLKRRGPSSRSSSLLAVGSARKSQPKNTQYE